MTEKIVAFSVDLMLGSVMERPKLDASGKIAEKLEVNPSVKIVIGEVTGGAQIKVEQLKSFVDDVKEEKFKRMSALGDVSGNLNGMFDADDLLNYSQGIKVRNLKAPDLESTPVLDKKKYDAAIKNLKGELDKMDKDGDGYLDRTEYSPLLLENQNPNNGNKSKLPSTI